MFLRLITGRQINNFCTSIDLKILALVCQLLRLFATENEGNLFLHHQIIEIIPGEHYPWQLFLASLSGTLALVTGNLWRQTHATEHVQMRMVISSKRVVVLVIITTAKNTTIYHYSIVDWKMLLQHVYHI